MHSKCRSEGPSPGLQVAQYDASPPVNMHLASGCRTQLVWSAMQKCCCGVGIKDRDTRTGCCSGTFFFLRYGRSRSKARSLHEKKLLVRKLLHGLFFRPTPSWLSPGRSTYSIARQNLNLQINMQGRLLNERHKSGLVLPCTCSRGPSLPKQKQRKRKTAANQTKNNQQNKPQGVVIAN